MLTSFDDLDVYTFDNGFKYDATIFQNEQFDWLLVY